MIRLIQEYINDKHDVQTINEYMELLFEVKSVEPFIKHDEQHWLIEFEDSYGADDERVSISQLMVFVYAK